VDHLDLPVLGEGLRVCGQTSSVPAIVTGELTGQVGGGVTLAEWACRKTAAQQRGTGQTRLLRKFLLLLCDGKGSR
jgi:hypothetical protein